MRILSIVTARLVGTAGIVLLLTECGFAQVKVAAGTIEDSRRNDGFFNRLKVELKLSGASLSGARGVRVAVTKAADETGKDLLNDKPADKDFKELDATESEAKLEIELKNPERRAMTVQEISGTVELFSPAKDPRSTIEIANFQRNIGKPITSPSLKAAGIEITVWTKEMFDARKKAEEEKLNKELEQKAKQAEKTGKTEDVLGALTEGLTAIFGGLMSSFASMGENDLAFHIKDAQSKLVSISIEDAQGKPIEREGRMSMGGSDDKTVIYNFKDKPAANSRIRIFVLTSASIVRSSFKLTGVPLP